MRLMTPGDGIEKQRRPPWGNRRRSGFGDRFWESEAVSALVRMRRRLDDLGISHYRAVATSAVRETRNGGGLVDRIRRESGIHLETISGSDEARLVWIAVTDRVDFADERWLMMDLGGGSVEISVAGGDRGVVTRDERRPDHAGRAISELKTPRPRRSRTS